MRYLKRSRRVFLICLLVWGSAASGGQAAAQDIPDAKVYLESVYERFQSLDSLHGDVTVNLKTPFMDMVSNSAADLLMKPGLLGKISTELVLCDARAKETKTQVTQYLQVNDTAIITYTQQGDKWLKQTIPYGLLEQADTADSKEFMAVVKEVKFVRQTADEATLEVVMDMEKVQRLFAQVMQESAKQVKPAPELADQKIEEVLHAVFRHMGDVSYTVTVDKQANCVTAVHMDLSAPVQNSAAAVIDALVPSDQERAMYKLFVQDIQLTIEERFSRFNQVKPFEIPQEAIDKAETFKPLPSAA